VAGGDAIPLTHVSLKERGWQQPFQADVFPRPAAILLLGAMAGFLFVFFVAEFLPPAAGQVGTAVFGVLLALGIAWIGVALWLRSPAA
jgi:hypothetical protein